MNKVVNSDVVTGQTKGRMNYFTIIICLIDANLAEFETVHHSMQNRGFVNASKHAKSIVYQYCGPFTGEHVRERANSAASEAGKPYSVFVSCAPVEQCWYAVNSLS